MNLWIGIGTLDRHPISALLGEDAGHVCVLHTFYYVQDGRAVFDKTPVWILSDRLFDVVRNAELGTLFQVEARSKSLAGARGVPKTHLIARSITVLAGPKGSVIPRSKAKVNRITAAKRLADVVAESIPELPTITLTKEPE